MRNIKLTIEYDGTNFKGWQSQANGERTVQSEIKKAIKKVTRENIPLIGSGRTDTGVHAREQVANFKTDSKLSMERIQKALNAHLPDDIAITHLQEVADDFHAQYSIKSKTYRYTILNRDTRSPEWNSRSLHYPYSLNISKMKREAKSLLGKHDFRSFQSNNRVNAQKNSIRTIKKLTIRKEGDLIFVDITADGFLYKMVRNIVGTLLAIGNGKLKEGSIAKILSKKDRTEAPAAVKPHGLCLLKTSY